MVRRHPTSLIALVGHRLGFESLHQFPDRNAVLGLGDLVDLVHIHQECLQGGFSRGYTIQRHTASRLADALLTAELPELACTQLRHCRILVRWFRDERDAMFIPRERNSVLMDGRCGPPPWDNDII